MRRSFEREAVKLKDGFKNEDEEKKNVCDELTNIKGLICFRDDSNQRDARHSHLCEDRRDAETAHLGS